MEAIIFWGSFFNKLKENKLKEEKMNENTKCYMFYMLCFNYLFVQKELFFIILVFVHSLKQILFNFNLKAIFISFCLKNVYM